MFLHMEVVMDFKDISSRVSIFDAATILGLEVKNNRSACPECKRGGERALQFFPDTQKFKCWAGDVWGDSVQLVSHVKGVKMLEAASFLVSHNGLSQDIPKRKAFDRVKYQDVLKRDHELLSSSGVTPDHAVRFDIGVAVKGVHQGRIVFPLYENGKFVAYASASDIKLPKLAEPQNQR